MTCRIEMYYKPQPVPRSCPDCGLGPCKQSLKLISTGDGFKIERPTGQVDTFDRNGNCISSRGAVGVTGGNLPTPEQLKAELAENQRQLKQMEQAEADAKREANPKTVGIGDRGLASGDPLRSNVFDGGSRVIPVSRKLKLIGYLADNFDQRGNYTVHDLDGMVDKIAAILLDN